MLLAFQDTSNAAESQAVRDCVVAEGNAVVPAQAVIGSDPEIAARAVAETERIVGEQSVSQGIIPERKYLGENARGPQERQHYGS